MMNLSVNMDLKNLMDNRFLQINLEAIQVGAEAIQIGKTIR